MNKILKANAIKNFPLFRKLLNSDSYTGIDYLLRYIYIELIYGKCTVYMNYGTYGDLFSLVYVP